MSISNSGEITERSLCGNCERRKSISAPSGTATKLARDIGATVTGCLDVCNRYSIAAGLDGINYIYKSVDAPDQIGTIVTDAKGEPLPVLEIYEPQRVSIEYSLNTNV